MRKAERNLDPLERAREQQEREPDSKHDRDKTMTEALVGSTVIARTRPESVLRAGRALYFPLEDCTLKYFAASSKRWR